MEQWLLENGTRERGITDQGTGNREPYWSAQEMVFNRRAALYLAGYPRPTIH